MSEGGGGRERGRSSIFQKEAPHFPKPPPKSADPPTSKDRAILTGRTLAERRPPQPEPPQVLHARGERQGRRLDGRRG